MYKQVLPWLMGHYLAKTVPLDEPMPPLRLHWDIKNWKLKL